MFLSGDDTACTEMTDLEPAALTVAVKRALGQAAAETLHPALTREQLTQTAAAAIRQADQVRPFTLTGEVEVEVDLYRPHTVDLAALVPGVRRAPGARTVAYTARDVAEAYRLLMLLVELGQIEPA